MLYKYRGLSNLRFALDIFVNQRLYAAGFESLNDPMEGHYVYEDGTLTKPQIRAIYGQKRELGILSLSETPNNMLMWSYYAESNQGMVVGVEISDQNVQIVPIDYVDELTLEKTHPNLPIRILSKKLKPWSHEQERRVFTRGAPYVDVKVKELIFGLNTDKHTKELVSDIAKKFCPCVKVRTILSDELERGLLAQVNR